jgi:hypothetical protein
VAGRTEFADDERIQRRTQGPRHLVGHRQSSASQSQYDHIGLAAIGLKQSGQNLAGLVAIFEHPTRLLAANPGS